MLGRLSDRYGPRILAVSGFLLGAPGLIWLRLAGEKTARDIALFVTGLVLVGFAGGLSLPALMSEASRVVEEEEQKDPEAFKDRNAYAQAYGLVSAAQGLGGVLGAFAGGMLRDKYGWDTMTLIFGILYGSSALPIVSIWAAIIDFALMFFKAFFTGKKWIERKE